MLIGYSVFLAAASGLRPFWLDEILQLIGTRDLSGSALLHYIRENPGAAPLGYFLQHWAIAFLGFSFFSARATAEICSVLTCLALMFASRKDHKSVWSIALVWMILPLPLRYALEARPYSQGLLFSALGTLCVLSIAIRPTPLKGFIYAAIIALGLYSAPYTAFLQTGYVLSLGLARRSFKAVLPAVGGLIGGALTFLPWYLWSSRYWSESLARANDGGFSLTPKFPLLLIREISGGGYYCSIPLILLALAGCRSARISRTAKSILISGIAAGVLFAVLADARFGYFFATRQILFILAPVAILAAEGFRFLLERRQWTAAAVLGISLATGSLIKDFRYLTDKSEDWAAGADALRSAARTGACIQFADDQSANLFRFFDPAISTNVCGASRNPRIVAPTNRYTRPDQAAETVRQLRAAGFRKVASSTVSGNEISIYESGKPE
jgi:hypothetical protein